MKREQQTDGQMPVTFGVDSWGYKEVAGPAYPLSLFVNNKGLQKLVEQCENEDRLLSLYNDNKQRIEKYPDLKLSFAERQRVLQEQEKI